MLVIQIRGTNGSGKSHTVFGIMKKYGKIPLRKGDGTVWAYRILCRPALYVLGRYETDCGGCDTINTMDGIYDGVHKLAELGGDVLFEGLLCAGLHERSMVLSKDMGEKGKHCIFAFIDTSMEKCIKRVLKRRAKKGNEKVFNQTNLTSKFKQIISSRPVLEKAGLDCRTLPHKKAVETILKWRKEYHDHPD